MFSLDAAQHWAIENSLHYVKDVVQQEDDSGIRKKNAPQNISIITNSSLNLMQLNNYHHTASATRLANNIAKLKELWYESRMHSLGLLPLLMLHQLLVSLYNAS